MLVSHRRGNKESPNYKKTDNGWGEREGNIELIGLQRLAACAGEATEPYSLEERTVPIFVQSFIDDFTRGTSKLRC